MKIKSFLSKLENFFFHITPPFYLTAVILGCLTVLPMLISPYIDKKNDEYKISLMQETMRLNNLSLEIYEKNKNLFILFAPKFFLLFTLFFRKLSFLSINYINKAKTSRKICERKNILFLFFFKNVFGIFQYTVLVSSI